MLWAWYEFARSISLAAFLLYFSQWLVIDRGVPDLWYNAIFAAASAMLVLTAPFAALAADRRRLKMTFLRAMTAAEMFALAVVGVLASYLDATPLVLALAAIFFAVSNYFHQFASIFYNALLSSIAHEGEEGRVSGFGLFAKLLGTVAGLAFAIPFGNTAFAWLGHPGRSQVFLPSVLLSSVLMLPSLFMKEPASTTPGEPSPASGGFCAQYRALAALCRHPGVGAYLLGYFLFNDAILTVHDNLPIYMERVLLIPDKTKSVILAGTLFAGALGGLFGGMVADRVGIKRALRCILALWFVLLPLAAAASAHQFTVLLIVLGVMFGITITVTRATMVYLAPQDRPTYAFSYYTIAENFSTFLGPLAWGGITLALADIGPARYRAALLGMAVFVAAGLAAIWRIPDDRPGRAKANAVTPCAP